MAVPYSFDDSMRIHDKAIYDWLGTLRVDYGNIAGATRNDFAILRVFASPQRAFAQVADLLAALGWIDGIGADKLKENADRDFAVLPLPVASIERGEPAQDTELAGVPKIIRRQFLNPKTGLWEFHQWPGHYRTDYTITFWSVKTFTEVFIREWVYGQLGLLGRTEYEVLIPVQHREPWGELQQSLKFTGSGNLSNLEGEETRYMRYEFTFSLRTWITKAPDLIPDTDGVTDGKAEFIERIGTDASEFGQQHGRLDESENPLDVADLEKQTGNLFYFPFDSEETPTRWPKEGNATVAHGAISPRGNRRRIFHNTLKIGVADTSDRVELAERLVTKHGDGKAILGVSFEYVADEDVELRINQRDVDTDIITPAHSLILTKTRPWKRVHRFTVLDKDTFLAEIAGVPPTGDRTAHIHGVDLRLLSTLTKLAPTTKVIGGSETTYTWIGLANAPHLCILIITATTGGLNTVTVEDDDSSPAHTLEQTFDSSVNVGGVFLVQPVTDSIVAKVPNTTSLESIYVQRFHGPYNGHDFSG